MVRILVLAAALAVVGVTDAGAADNVRWCKNSSHKSVARSECVQIERVDKEVWRYAFKATNICGDVLNFHWCTAIGNEKYGEGCGDPPTPKSDRIMRPGEDVFLNAGSWWAVACGER